MNVGCGDLAKRRQVAMEGWHSVCPSVAHRVPDISGLPSRRTDQLVAEIVPAVLRRRAPQARPRLNTRLSYIYFRADRRLSGHSPRNVSRPRAAEARFQKVILIAT